MLYHMSYGDQHDAAKTIKEARAKAKRISRRVLYKIEIVGNGDLIETLVPRIDPSGRVTFRTVKAGQSTAPVAHEHTPGPWRVKDNGSMEGPHVYGLVHPVDGGDYAPLAGYRGGALSQADARLIAAAPELLHALKSAAEFMHIFDEQSEAAFGNWADRGKLINAAIAKAEGKS